MERYTHIRTITARELRFVKDPKDILRHEAARAFADVGLKLADAADAEGKSEYTVQLNVRCEPCPELPGKKITVTATPIREGKP